jgi:hypothetical protein
MSILVGLVVGLALLLLPITIGVLISIAFVTFWRRLKRFKRVAPVQKIRRKSTENML